MENKRSRHTASRSPFCQESSYVRSLVRVQGDEVSYSDVQLLVLACLFGAFVDWILWGMK